MKPSIGTTSEGKTIPIDVERLIETRAVVLANSGAGKSWALRRVLEQTHGKVQQIVIDVEDEFATLREKFDYVLAGRQGGDCPADVRCAALLARRLLELRVSAIVGIYELKQHERIRFVRLFLEELVNAPKDLWHPVLVVIDEAHYFAPESAKAESTQAVIDLMTRGRKRGFCGVLASQRASMLSKDASAQAINKLIGRFSQDIDVKRAADDLGFYRREQQAELRSLKPGNFFAVGPAFCDTVTELMVGPVVTTHPRAGQRALAPPPPKESVKRVLATLADLPHEAEQEAQTVGDLKRKIRELETAARTPANPPQEPVGKIEERIRTKYNAELAGIREWIRRSIGILQPLGDSIEQAEAMLDKAANISLPFVMTEPAFDSRRIAVPPSVASVESNGNKSTNVGERKILVAIAQRADGLNSDTLGVLTGYKLRSRQEYLRRLLIAGFVNRNGDVFKITDAGLNELGNDWEPLPTGDALLEHWMATLPIGERKVLEIATASYPNPVTSARLKDATGYELRSVQEYARRLVARNVLTREGGAVKASAELFS